MAGKRIERVLITGSRGQIGSELARGLRRRYGDDNCIASDIKDADSGNGEETGPYMRLDVMDRAAFKNVVDTQRIDTIVHLAAILSATGERDPLRAWDINVTGLINALEVTRESGLTRILCPSSIAVFGDGCPRENTPQETVLKPRTMYGVTKVAGELLCDYYARHFGVDARGLRYPGIISSETLPGGGTTDYAVDMYYAAVERKRYTSFVKADTRLPMMYMPDCIRGTIDLLEADIGRLRHHGDFNMASMSFSVQELADSIRRHIPEFEITYIPDYRQAIADSWPASIDDSTARREWGWKPDYDLEATTSDMLRILTERHSEGRLYS